MKKIKNRYILLWCSMFLLLITSACKHVETYPSILLRIDSLTAQQPDSALYMLNLLDDFMPTQSEEIQMYHRLLTTKATEECQKPHTTDSVMKRVVKYYRKLEDTDKLMEAYYLLACVYRDLNDAPYALEYYQKATDVRAENHLLKSKAYSQMGTLFTYQGMYFEATDVLRKACRHARMVCDSLEIASHYRNLARNFAAREKTDSTLHYYELAGRYDAKGTLNEKIDVYIRKGDFEKAHRLLAEHREAYTGWGDYYHGINKRDSASIYYEHALADEAVDALQRLNIYRRLAMYAEERGRIMQALMYTKQVNNLLDSLSLKYNIEIEDRMRALYTRQYETKTEMDKSFQNERKEENSSMSWLVGLVPLVGLAGWWIFRHRKSRSSAVRRKEQAALPDLPMCRLVKTNARNPDFKLNDAQWEELQKEMDAAFNDFTNRLLEVCPKLSDVELHVCYLLKLGVSPTDIAHIIVRQANTVSSIRERLYKKIYGENGSGRQLDQFIEGF